jgi:hypothetical protein
MALGASPAGVVWMVIRDRLVASVIGLGLGLALSAVVSQGMRPDVEARGRRDAGPRARRRGTGPLVASWIRRGARRELPPRALRE